MSIGAVAITVANPDDPDDYDEFEVTGGLRIDDGVADGEIGAGQGTTARSGPPSTGSPGYSATQPATTSSSPARRQISTTPAVSRETGLVARSGGTLTP